MDVLKVLIASGPEGETTGVVKTLKREGRLSRFVHSLVFF